MATLKPHALLILTLVLVSAAFAGCHEDPTTADADGWETTERSYVEMGFDGTHWPDLSGITLTILDHGAFTAFDDLAPLFANLTGATVVHVEAQDTGSVLNRAVLEQGDPSFDVIYGIDNLLYSKAVAEQVFTPYKPHLADDINHGYLFFEEDHDASDDWYATPVDHGYIGLNLDHDHPELRGHNVTTLHDVERYAHTFVTQDPRTSTPGLGFLITTIATFGESGDHTWKDYWADLFDGGVLITSGWTEAYMGHFSAAGEWVGDSARDKAIITSYAESPAYEAYFGLAEEDVAIPIVTPNTTFHQIQTMGIARGTPNLAAAQAWIEFSLTDAFQTTAAPYNAVYPVTTTDAALKSVSGTYQFNHQSPGTFQPVAFDHHELGENVERWIAEWVDLCEAHDCA